MTQDTAFGRVLHQVGTGTDALIVGPLVAQAALLAQAASALDTTRNVVQVAAPPAGLSLSGLMAQLSGRPDLGTHDDAVLELGFRRLTRSDDGRPTVLLLDGRAGLQRPVLRYLQHVGRGAPGLVLVLAAGPNLVEMLAEPGFAPLQARLAAHPAIAASPGTPAALKRPPLAVPPASVPPAAPTPARALVGQPVPTTPLAPRISERRGAVIWPWALAVGMAASVALGAWFGQVSRGEPDQTLVSVRPAPPISSQHAQPPRNPAAAPATELTPIPRPDAAVIVAPPEPAALADAPQASVPPHPGQHAAVAEAAPATPEAPGIEQPETKPLPLPPRPALRAEMRPRAPVRPRIAAAETLTPAPRLLRAPTFRRPVPDAEPPDWIRDEPPPEPAAPWRGARYVPPQEQPYIGTFTTGPYGNRVFRYDQP